MMSDNDFPATLGGKTSKGFLEEYLSGFSNSYSKVGNDPALQVGNEYGRVRGGPLYSETTIAGSPSFDLRFPKMPGIGANEQSIEGIPNATPEMIRRYMDRKIKNTGGQTLPGFLKGA